MDDIESQVIKLAAEHFCVPEDCVEPSSSFFDDLGADTLNVVEFILALEDQFRVAISEDDGGKLERVSDAIFLVKRLLKKRKQRR